MHRIATIVAAAIAITAAGATGAAPALAAHSTPAHPSVTAPAASYYLSLGDSLAQGVEPNAAGTDIETNQGYPNQLYTALKLGNPTLKLLKLGCPGETTATMENGGICTYSHASSQLARAVNFLTANAGHVQLVTIDIGANDLNSCLVLTNESKLLKCLNKVIPVALKNLEAILTTLRKADPTGTIIGMTYYDPELAGWLEGTKAAKSLATESVTLADVFAGDMRKVYTAFHVSIASAYTAFQTADLKDQVTLPAFGTVPLDVARICDYTYECAPKPMGPNEHANVLGYGVMANAFLKTYQG
jgi:lysophospholipase L1-like esterase